MRGEAVETGGEVALWVEVVGVGAHEGGGFGVVLGEVGADGLHDSGNGLVETGDFVEVGFEVAIEAVACGSAGEVVVLFDALEDLAHVCSTISSVSCVFFLLFNEC